MAIERLKGLSEGELTVQERSFRRANGLEVGVRQ